jgi:hypothetical protein
VILLGINASVFSAPTNVMALGHPFCSPAYNNGPGVIIGIDAYSRQLVYADPWWLQGAGIIHSTFGLVIGPKKHGKSATMKILSMRLMLMAAGYEQMRVAINDYKPEGKASEYEEFSAYMASKVFKIGEMSVNPFEIRLHQLAEGSAARDNVYELGILGTAEIMCEFAKGAKLSGHEHTALRIALYAMLQYDSALWSPPLLLKMLRSITEQQITAYFNNLDSKLQAQLEARIARVSDPSLRDTVTGDMRALVSAKDNYSVGIIQTIADTVSTYLGTILTGTYGNMFGDTHSLYDMTTQRAVTKDWRGVGEDAEALMRTLDTQLKISAIENNRIDLLPHIELDDEKHRSMDILVYAKTNSFLSEISRGVHTLNLSATHQLDSIRRGGMGSELYNLGNTIINNMGFVLIGQQADDPKVLGELQARYNLSTAQTRQLTTLPRFTFLMKLGETESPRVIRFFATPEEMKVLQTSAATDRMLTRPDVMNKEDLQQFATQNGIVYLGEDET